MPEPAALSPLRPRAEELYGRMVDSVERLGRGRDMPLEAASLAVILAEIATIKAALEAAGLIEIPEVPR